MRWPLLSLFDTDNHGHIGFVVEVTNMLVSGRRVDRSWVAAQSRCRLAGRQYHWQMAYRYDGRGQLMQLNDEDQQEKP